VPELIEDQKTGFLCEPLDGPSMRRAVERVLAAPEAAAQVARQAKERAKERFSPAVIARRHVEIYREVLTRHPVRANEPTQPACATTS
jgi:glycosyltransferase involved in cell wall biosynthesis